MSASRSQNTDVACRDKKRRIGIISLSAIADDPRVRRQGDLFTRAGWEVVAIGLPGHRSPLPAWRCLAVDLTATRTADTGEYDYRSRAAALLTALRQAVYPQGVSPATAWLAVIRQAAFLAVKDPAALLWSAGAAAARLSHSWVWMRARRLLRASGGAITPEFAERLYWGLNDNFRQIYRCARSEQVDLWLANDWTTLPIARRLSKDQGIPFAYDTHELAADEYAQRWMWRLMQRPVIAAIEGSAMRQAAFVSCVSEGIAQRLVQFYKLAEVPLVVRNMPAYESARFRSTGERVRVLYHGLVSPGRGLEACIESVPLWRPEFSLTIRGPGSPEYLAHLTDIARKRGVTDRVAFAKAVPMVELVSSAAEHDVGLFALPSHSLQNVHALPNKFFEYVMAGLALCVSDLPEMARVLKERDFGVLIEDVTPEAIAAAINCLDRTAIDTYKRKALAAARELNWENEGRRLLEACERAISVDRTSDIELRDAVSSQGQRTRR